VGTPSAAAGWHGSRSASGTIARGWAPANVTRPMAAMVRVMGAIRATGDLDGQWHDSRIAVLEALNHQRGGARGISIEVYSELREMRSAVENEFNAINEATSRPARFSPERFKRLSNGREIIWIRNILTQNHG